MAKCGADENFAAKEIKLLKFPVFKATPFSVFSLIYLIERGKPKGELCLVFICIMNKKGRREKYTIYSQYLNIYRDTYGCL